MPPTDVPRPPGTPLPGVDVPFPESSVWPAFMPFGQRWNPMVQLMADLGIGLLVIVLLAGIVAGVIGGVSRSRNARHTRKAAEGISRPLVETLSVKEGIVIARYTLLRGIQREWSCIPLTRKRVMDPKLVSETVDHLMADWTVSRMREFCLRYHRPLSTLMDNREMDRVFTHARLVLRGKNRIFFPRMVGIGESDTGMYVMYATDPSLTLNVWSEPEVMDILAYALDAPNLEIEEAEGQLIVLHLNDAPQRAAQSGEDDAE